MGSRLEANSDAVRKRIAKHSFDNEEGEEYSASNFGGFNDYFRRKKIKLQNLDVELRSSSEHPPIFRGVVAHVNGYTQPSLNDIHALIVSHGGGFMQYLDGKTTVTHIVASNLTPKKKEEFARYRIVKPAWVVDSVCAGKLLPWNSYRVLDEGVGQRILSFENGSIKSQTSQSQLGYRDQTDSSWYTSHVSAYADHLNEKRSSSSSRAEHAFRLDEQSPLDKTNLGPSKQGNYSKREGNGSWEELKTDDVGFNNNKPQTENTSRERRAAEPISSFDLDTVPALNDPLTDSQTNTQANTQTQSQNTRPENTVTAADFQSQRQALIKSNELERAGPAAQELEHDEARDVPLDQSHIPTNANDALDDSSEAQHLSNEMSDNLQTQEKSAQLMKGSLKHGPFQEMSEAAADMTPEEHNAILLSDPKIWKSTVVNPAFLKQYYEESRLHHLSAWKASLKTQLQGLAAEKTLSQKGREKRPAGARRYILHVDFDSFFAAVSLKKHPEYMDKPVVIAHGTGAGAEIASSNYPARKFGIKNGMWMKHAQKMCPDLKVLPYDFKAYEEASRQFYEAIIETGGVVQSVSVDEALVDISMQCLAAGGHDGEGAREGSLWREQSKAAKIAQDLRDKVRSLTGCEVSVGIGGNILLAKVALRKAKPAGQYHVKPEDALDFLGELRMQDLPGIAWSIGGKLDEVGVKYVRDVRTLSKERMISILGPKTGEKIWDYSRGIDRVEVGEQVVRKSVSAEVNWGIRFVTQEQAEEFIQSLCDELHKRLVNEGVKGKQLTIKIMRRAADAPRDPPKHLGHGKCDTFNKSIILGVATNDAQILGREAISILRGWGFSPGELRGIGCQMQRLEPIKGLPESLHDSSQKRLQFKTVNHVETAKSSRPMETDEVETPPKPKVQPSNHPAGAFSSAVSPSGRQKAPLNIMGTQFMLPSQVDAETLAELPQDIRSKLFPNAMPCPGSLSPKPVGDLPAGRESTTFPSESQLDPDALDALPEDVRAEVLAQYNHSPGSKLANQSVLPQSPRKDRATKLPKKLTTPTKKRGRPAGIGSRFASRAVNAGNKGFSTLTQSNFTTTAPGAPLTGNGSDAENEIAPDFLDALPDDIRHELLAETRRERLQKRSGLDFSTSTSAALRRKHATAAAAVKAASVGQRVLTLPCLPARPTFTARKLSNLPDLREAITAWHDEFSGEGEKGPYAEDVEALVRYLGRVVGDEEGDMEKAVQVVKWMTWIVEEHDDGKVEGSGNGNSTVEGPKELSEEEQISWREAIRRVEAGVQEAVRKRGLGEVIF